MPFFSIVIPTFNRKEALRETILHFSTQTFRDFELIVADDGSTDGTGDMLRDIPTPFPVLHYWHRNAGRSAARNMGVRHAKGTVILFVDDHIYADSRLLEEHYRFHRQYDGTDVAVVRGNVYYVQTREEIPEQPPYVDLAHFKVKGEQNPFRSFFTNNVSIRKSALEAVGGFEESFTEYGFQDSELGYRLRRAGYRIKINPNAIGYIFSAKLTFQQRCDKMRQAGHSAVILMKKHFWLGVYVGINPFNLLVFWLLSAGNRFLLRKMYIEKLEGTPDLSDTKQHKLESRIRYYYFLFGIFEKLFSTSSLKLYYEEKQKARRQ